MHETNSATLTREANFMEKERRHATNGDLDKSSSTWSVEAIYQGCANGMHLRDANDHVLNVTARRADGRICLTRREPSLNLQSRFRLICELKIDRQVPQVFRQLATRSLDGDNPGLHCASDPIRDRDLFGPKDSLHAAAGGVATQMTQGLDSCAVM